MGVCELSPSNEYIKEIKNPIKFNNESKDITDKDIKSYSNIYKNEKNDNIKNININKNTSLNMFFKTNEKIKRIINTNKLSNYIHNSKTNYSNYKRVPHIKSPTDPLFPSDKKPKSNTNSNALITNKINPEDNNILWFQTQYNNFNEIKDEKSINEYNKKNYKNMNNSSGNEINKSCKTSNINIFNINKPPIIKNTSKNKSNIIYTKALPIDYNNEKKIENIFKFKEKNIFNDNNLLYAIEKKNLIKNDNSNNNYSSKKEYKFIIKKYSNNKYLLSNYLLELKERNWHNELISISNILINKRTDNDILISNKYIRKIIKLQEQFKWIIESLGIYFNSIIFGKDNNNYLHNNNNYNLPTKDKMKWFNGFKWKGIYIKVITHEKRKILLNEIKALNYFYFDYLQLLEQYPYFQINQLLYHIIFPLIAYCEINGFYLFGSAIININDYSETQNNFNSIKDEISLDDIIYKNKGVLNYFNNDKISINIILKKQNLNDKNYTINDLEKKYYIKDLLKSKLFSELNLFHFIRIIKNKFLIFNLFEFIPKLFENKLNNVIKINYLSVINNKRVYYSTNIKQNINNNKEDKPTNLKNGKYFPNPKEILSNIYPNLSHLKTKDIIINNIYFRIIYEAQIIKDDNYKNKQFVDYLYNYNNYYSSNSIGNKSESYIVEPYLILYNLLDPIKLKYSLIKQFHNGENNIKNTNNSNDVNAINKNAQLNNILNKLFYISSNYISYFTSWCEMLNKNTFNIKTYPDLKENMNKYGISSQLKFFALININNQDILDIIKISLLIKAIKFIFNKKDNDNILNKLNDNKNNNISCNNNTNDVNKISEYRRAKLLYIIKSILFTNEIINQSKQFFINLFEELLFYVNIIFLKLKLIDEYLSLGLLNINKNNNINMNINIISKKISGFESPKDFLKHIIATARNKPFLFLTEMELKLKFIIDPFLKFKSSISIESLSNKLELKHIILNTNNRTFSYINSNEISGLILSKLIFYANNNQNAGAENKEYNNRNNTNNIDDLNINVSHSNCNLALKPSYMKTNINLNSYKSSIKNKDSNPLQISLTSFSQIEYNNKNKSNKTSKENLNLNLNNSKNPTAADFVLQFSECNEEIIDNKYTNIKLLEKEICDNFNLELPSICYKMKYNYENSFKKNENFSKFLKNLYFLPEINMIKRWFNCINKVFHDISSSNGEIEHSLFKILVFKFIITFFYEKNFNEANQINAKIKDIFKKGNYQLSLVDLSMINLFQALSSEKYIESETPYSKCLMLLLMSYGEPRGRNNDSHGVLTFPIWKIARKTRLEQKAVNDYFKEMFQCLSFFEKKKCFLNMSNIKSIFNYSNNVYNNYDNIKIYNNMLKEININNIGNENPCDDFQNISASNESTISDFLSNNINENPGLDFFTNFSKITNNFDISINLNIFDDKILNKKIIKYFKFPPVSCNVEKLDKIFFKVEFIIFFLKQIQSLFIGKKIIFNEDYINEYISDEIFNPYPYNYKHQITCTSIESDTNDDFTEENSSKNVKKFNNCEICMHKEKIKKLEKNEYFVFPNNSNFIYNFIEDKRNLTVKNRKINEQLSSTKEKIRVTMINSNINMNKHKEKIKNKNKSVEGIKKRKNNLFSHFLYQELLQKLSHKLNIQSGVVISFGNNTHNETSHDNYDKITLPRMIFKLKNERIKHIFSGWEHNIILTNNGDIYSFGNNNNFQCGLSNKDNSDKIIKDPINISILNNNIKGIYASCGNDHSLILDSNNEVYAFGSNEDGSLGVNDLKIKKYEFTKINFGKYTNKIKDISAGTVHNLALTKDNKIFSWGSSQGGQLGFSESYLLSQPNYKDSFVLCNPTLIPIFSQYSKKYEDFSKIGCGEAHSIALNNEGKVYSWGFGSNGQLGLGFCEDSFEPGMGLYKSRKFIPEIIEYLKDEKIIDIKCGKTFTMFINDKYELYACGVNDLNQLGITEPCSKEHVINKEIQCYDCVFPTKVDCFLNMKVLKIACGEGHCLGVIKDLISNIITIWSWGNNNLGQLGQGSIVKKSKPNPINYLSDYNSKKFDEISCGGFHSLCLIKYKEGLNWIDEDLIIISKVIDDFGIV